MPRHRGARHRVETGIYEDASGYAVMASVGAWRQERRYPSTTPIGELRAHRAELLTDMRRDVERRQRRAPKAGTLAADAARYLALPHIAAMASYPAREWQINAWARSPLGKRRRDTLTSADIRAQLHAFRAEGAAPEERLRVREDQQRRKWRTSLSEETCNKLRSALMHLYTTLDGKHERNPAREVPKFRAEQDEGRAIPALTVARILHQFRPGSKTRARLAVMATTGMTQAEIMRMRPKDLDLAAGLVVARARRKGRGAEPRAIPLSRHARLALRAFVRADAWGKFSTSSMRSRFLDACARLGLRMLAHGHASGLDWRPYDLRHTFLTAVGLAGDERAVQALGGHADIRTTGRYTRRSVDPRVAVAIASLDRERRPK